MSSLARRSPRDLPRCWSCRSPWPSSPRSTEHYPFHGRLILELVPALFLLIAEGTEWIARRWDRSRAQASSINWSCLVLIAYPCCDGAITLSRSGCATSMRTGIFTAMSSATYLSENQAVFTMTVDGGLIDGARGSQKRRDDDRFPPFMADSWAQSPTMVQLAEVAASGRAGRSPLTAIRKAWTRCGCEPPWPPPWRNERCSASCMAVAPLV